MRGSVDRDVRQFTTNQALRTSPLPLRVTATGFLLFVALGYATNLGLLAWKTHLSPTGVARYYRGYEPAVQTREEIHYPKEFHELLENTHFHIYTVPVVLLILTHLFFMTGWSGRTKLGVTLLAYAAALADLAAPWLVRYGPAGFAWWKIVSALLYHATLFFLVAACLWETWGSPRSHFPHPSVPPRPTQREAG